MRTHHTLLCWQVARDLTAQTHQLTVRRWSPPASAAFDQLRRASLSVRLNIAEGHALASPGAFARHLNVAYGSAVETTEILEFCTETGLLTSADTKPLIELGRRVEALVLRLRIRCLAERKASPDRRRC